MKSVSEVAALLHQQVCQSMNWSEECQKSSGGGHAQRQMGAARAILASADPDAALHDQLCEAHVHWTHHSSMVPGVRCGNYGAHVEAYRKANLLGRVEQDTPL